ncbi:MAG: InlB B-repeat-containing protein [Prevotellaceae bacterium]|jgi:uncharacterized repeat protein (TIGR02543 family)|nr:InlB B-repeat-containing protein [Prevotellaceae bacterium]
MKKLMKFSVLFAAVVIALGSCKQNEPKFTVTFNSNGGTAVAEQTVADGAKVVKPTDPIRADFAFAGWYKDQATTTAWDFATDVVTSNITLYAKWEQSNPNPKENYDYEDTAATNITFSGAGVYLQNDGVYYVQIMNAQSTYLASLVVYPNSSGIEGTYPINFSEEAGTVLASPGSVQAGYVSASFVGTIVSGGIDEVWFLVGGSVTITATSITVNATSYYGSTINITATLSEYVEPPVPGLYDDEPTTATTINLNFTEGEVTNYGDWYYVGGDNLMFYAYDEENFVQVDFIATGSGLTSIPVNTYPINNSFSLNTVAAYVEESAGDGGGTMLYNGDDQYFVVSGNVVVTGTGLTVTGQSYNGSTINITYTGSLAATPSYAPAKIVKKSNLAKNQFGKINKQFPIIK